MREGKQRGGLRPRPGSLAAPTKAGRIVLASGNAQHRIELQSALLIDGHRVVEVQDSDQALRIAVRRMHDVLILDSDIEGSSSCELCRSIRSKSDIGIIVVSSDDASQTRIDALNAGADDFVPLPVIAAELLARVRAILRRVSRAGERAQIILQDREVDLKSFQVKGPGTSVSHLTPKEFLVLQYLIAQGNKPSPTQTLAQTIWQRDGSGGAEYVRAVIRQLRLKLEPIPANPRYIITDGVAGYRFQMPTAR
jgi:two-component system KDP operon response regulator KdpE